MSQLIACQWQGGLVMAADRRVETRRDGAVQGVRALRKLFPLGPGAAVATSGAAVGIGISRVLAQRFRRRTALPLQKLENYALAVFQQEYDQFVHRGARWFATHPEALRRSYLLLGGHQRDGSYHFRLHASEEHGDPFHPLGMTQVLAAPRRLGLEGRLARVLATEPTDPRPVVDLVAAGLRHIASRDASVAAPFDLVAFSPQGSHWQVIHELGELSQRARAAS